MRERLIFLLCLFVLGCGSSNPPAVTSNAQTNQTLLGRLVLNLSFSDLVAGNLQPTGGVPAAVQNIRISMVRADGGNQFEPLVLTPTQLQNRTLAQGSTLGTELENIPLNEVFVLRLEGLDSNDNRIFDNERRVKVGADGQVESLALTPVGAVLSGAFFKLPVLSITPQVRARFEPEAEQMAADGFFLVENAIVHAPSACSSWTLEVGTNTFKLDPDGRIRFPASAANGVTTAILRHPTDERLSAEVPITSLGQGQFTDEGFFLKLAFEGGCGMDDRTIDDDFCGVPIDLPPSTQTSDPAREIAILAQAARAALAASVNTTNNCNQRVPKPTQFEVRARGHYPQPKNLLTDGSEFLLETQAQCEQSNGRTGDGQAVEATGRGSQFDYLTSTCNRYVAFGCCPNENFVADLANLPGAVLEGVIEAAFDLGSYFTGSPERNILDPAIIPSDSKTCPDNHKGRQCQETLIGDVSLDFGARGGVKFPRETELKVVVQPGEIVEFVLHNNGCFGNTELTSTRREIGGALRRTHKEFTLTPAPEGNRLAPKLATSSDPLLGDVPTAGLLEPTPPPINRNVTPAPPTSDGFGGISKTINHFQIDGSIPENSSGTAKFRRYRYFVDVSMHYQVPADAQPGQVDRYVFSVDECEVAVTFCVGEPPIITDPPPITDPSPTPSTSPPPADNVNVNPTQLAETHIIGTSPCPQPIGTIAVGNRLNEQVNVSVQVVGAPALNVTPVQVNLQPGTGATIIDVFFDCSTTTSFNGTVRITTSSSQGTEVVDVPVAVTII